VLSIFSLYLFSFINVVHKFVFLEVTQRCCNILFIFLKFFYLSWSHWYNSSTLSSISDTLFLTCPILTEKLSVSFLFGYFVYNFQNIRLIFSGFLYLCWIPLPYSTLSFLFHSAVCLQSFWGYSTIVCKLFNSFRKLHIFLNHSHLCSFGYIVWMN
jgi:hypothetical protein